MLVNRFRLLLIPCCVVLYMSLAQTLAAATLCVNPHQSGCYATIQAAVNHASAYDVISVAAGTYKEHVTIGIPVSIVGAGAESTIVDAANLPHGFFVDGFDPSRPRQGDHRRIHGRERSIRRNPGSECFACDYSQ